MESSVLTPVAPVRPVAPYVGGKRNLAGRLSALIETVPHDLYAEPFVGMGGVFLRRRSRPKVELINDINGELTNFYRIVQEHYVFFLEMMRFYISSRTTFDRLLRTDPATLTDLQRAGQFLYLQRLAFGGKVVGRNFGMDHGRSSRFDMTRLGPMLEDLHDRLSGVTIECLPWRAFLARYDRPGALFYLDPPYWQCENDYGDNVFSRDDFTEMAEVLGGLKGKFILSINDHPEVRRIFGRFAFEPVGTHYGLCHGSKPVRELIIASAGVFPEPANDA